MNLNTKDPYQQGRNEAMLDSLRRYNCEPVESDQFPGCVYFSKCKACGHKLRINQNVYRIRHWLKCGSSAD